MSIKKFLKEIVFTVLMVFVVSMVLNYIRQPEIHENIYDYTLKDINQETIDFSTYKEKPLVVHFWATWCPTCKLEASNIDEVSKTNNVVTIAVTSGSNSEIKTFLKEKNLNFKVINDKDGVLAQKFNISAFPTTLIYDTNGSLKFTEVGYTTTLGLKTRIQLAE